MGWRSRRLVWLAGFALIAVGILCLFLSGVVAAIGTWWQNTLDAFGVGFIVGGIVDVLAISGLTWRAAVEDEALQEYRWVAEQLLSAPLKGERSESEERLRRSNEISSLIFNSGGRLSPQIQDRLHALYIADTAAWQSETDRPWFGAIAEDRPEEPDQE